MDKKCTHHCCECLGDYIFRLEQQIEKLKEALIDFADFGIERKYSAWPKNEYQKKARATLSAVNQMAKEGKE